MNKSGNHEIPIVTDIRVWAFSHTERIFVNLSVCGGGHTIPCESEAQAEALAEGLRKITWDPNSGKGEQQHRS